MSNPNVNNNNIYNKRKENHATTKTKRNNVKYYYGYRIDMTQVEYYMELNRKKLYDKRNDRTKKKSSQADILASI